MNVLYIKGLFTLMNRQFFTTAVPISSMNHFSYHLIVLVP